MAGSNLPRLVRFMKDKQAGSNVVGSGRVEKMITKTSIQTEDFNKHSNPSEIAGKDNIYFVVFVIPSSSVTINQLFIQS